jgi:hypothetical protein
LDARTKALIAQIGGLDIEGGGIGGGDDDLLDLMDKAQ